MFGSTGRYSVQFRHGDDATYVSHLMMNTDSQELIVRGYEESRDATKRIIASGTPCDVMGIRICDNVTGHTVIEWIPA